MPGPRAASPLPCAPRRGLTLLELVIVMAVLAVLSTLALPSMGRQLERHRLQAAAEALAADLADARFEAARRGRALHLDIDPSTPWCWAVTTAPGCRCGLPQDCQLRTVRAEDHRGVRLLAAQAVRFDGDGRADRSVGAVLESGGERLHVEVGALGRARICDPNGRLPRVPRC